MRVTFNSQYRDLQTGIDRASETLLEMQRQVSSGKRISKPSDDPEAAAAAVTGRNDITRLERYTQAADSVTSRLTVIDTVLSDMTDKLSQARTTAMGASGTLKTEMEREAAAQTLTGLRDAIFDDLNTSFNGIHVFAGTASSTRPYDRNPDGTVNPTYQGSTDEVEVDVDTGRAVKVTYNGESLAKGSDPDDIFTVFENLIDAVRGGPSITSPSDQPGIDAAVQGLKTALQRISTVQTRVGTQMKTLEELKPQLAEMKLQAQTGLDKTENVDMAEAITGMTQAETAYRAALGAAGTTTKTSLMDFIR
jgi:flagellar hook-associated protein 3 FlgL